MRNKRVFQILHASYCTGLIENSNGIIIEPDLGAFKYIRYINSTKPKYVQPEKEKFTKIISLGGGVERPNYNGVVYTNFGLSFDRRLDCLTSISHGFELALGLPKTEDLGYSNTQTYYKNIYSKNYFRYRLLYKYSISGWLTNTYNLNFKNENALTFNIGPNFDFSHNIITKRYESDVIYEKRVYKSPIALGVSMGFDKKCNEL